MDSLGARTGSAGTPAPGQGARTGSLGGHSRLVYERHGRLEQLLGKILWLPGEHGEPGVWVFRRDLKPQHLLRALDGFSIDLPVLEMLEAALVDEVHCKYQGVLYAVTVSRLRDKGIRWDKARHGQWVLPRSYWTRRLDYPQERVPESRRQTVEIP